MNERRILETLLAFAGIWMMIRQIPDYAGTLAALFSGSGGFVMAGREFFVLQGFHLAASGVIGLVLLASRKIVAAWIFPNPSTVTFSGEGLFSAGVAIVGIYFFVTGLSNLGLFAFLDSGAPARQRLLVSGTVSAFLGMVLFAASRIVAVLYRLLSSANEKSKP